MAAITCNLVWMLQCNNAFEVSYNEATLLSMLVSNSYNVTAVSLIKNVFIIL